MSKQENNNNNNNNNNFFNQNPLITFAVFSVAVILIFKVLVGDFRTRIEAESFRKKLKREYPNCYVVESEVLISNL
jgi:cell division protease FtsH